MVTMNNGYVKNVFSCMHPNENEMSRSIRTKTWTSTRVRYLCMACIYASIRCPPQASVAHIHPGCIAEVPHGGSAPQANGQWYTF